MTLIKFKSRKNQLVDIFKSMYEQIWEMKTDVRNFNDSLAEFLKVFFAKSNLDNDSDDSFKMLLAEVSENISIQKFQFSKY